MAKKIINLHLEEKQHAALLDIKKRSGLPIQVQIRKALEYYIGTFPADECGHDAAQRLEGGR